MYAQTVPEDALVGRQILQVLATDADIQSNAEITYQLRGSGAESFTVDTKTGKIKFDLKQGVKYLIQGHNGSSSLINPFQVQAHNLVIISPDRY